MRSLAFSLALPSWKIKRMLHFFSFFVHVNASKAVRMSCTLDSLWDCCRAASDYGQARNRCVGKLRTAAVRPFLVRFTKPKHPRLDQDKIFPTIYWVLKSTEKWRRSARSKLPAGIGTVLDRPVPERAQATLIIGLLCFAATTTKITTGQVAAASQSIARALRRCARALRRYGKASFSAGKRRSETR